MAKDKRKFRVDEPPVIEGDAPSKRRLLRSGRFKEVTASPESRQDKGKGGVGLNSLPTELKLEVANVLGNDPSRRAAHDDLAALRLASKKWGQTVQFPKGLLRHPGVESRHLAVCLDVAGGMSAADAVRQHEPLPTSDKSLRTGDVEVALDGANIEQVASLANLYKDRQGSASKFMLEQIGSAAAKKKEQMESADLDTVAMLAGICAKNDGPDDAIETIVDVVWQRRHELANANSRQIAHFVSACSRGHEDTADWCLDLMADEVRDRREALVTGATDEQLVEMRQGFELAEGYQDDPDYADRQAAWELVGEEISNRAAVHELQGSSGRPALDNRGRDRSASRE